MTCIITISDVIIFVNSKIKSVYAWTYGNIALEYNCIIQFYGRIMRLWDMCIPCEN